MAIPDDDHLIASAHRHGREIGFTMVELLIIMAILGILSGIVVFAVLDVNKQSAQTACTGSYKTIETAAEAYKGEVGSYPSALDDLTTTQPGLNNQTVGPWLKEVPPVYSPGPPSSISGGAPYGFAIDSATSSIEVGTIKANGARSDSAVADGDAHCVSA